MDVHSLHRSFIRFFRIQILAAHRVFGACAWVCSSIHLLSASSLPVIVKSLSHELDIAIPLFNKLRFTSVSCKSKRIWLVSMRPIFYFLHFMQMVLRFVEIFAYLQFWFFCNLCIASWFVSISFILPASLRSKFFCICRSPYLISTRDYNDGNVCGNTFTVMLENNWGVQSRHFPTWWSLKKKKQNHHKN